jgi:hypothetical protein
VRQRSRSVNKITLPLFEVARVFVHFDHDARVIINANHCTMCSAVVAGVADSIAGSVRSVIPQPTEWERIGNQIDTVMILARPYLLNVHSENNINQPGSANSLPKVPTRL